MISKYSPAHNDKQTNTDKQKSKEKKRLQVYYYMVIYKGTALTLCFVAARRSCSPARDEPYQKQVMKRTGQVAICIRAEIRKSVNQVDHSGVEKQINLEGKGLDCEPPLPSLISAPRKVYPAATARNIHRANQRRKPH